MSPILNRRPLTPNESLPALLADGVTITKKSVQTDTNEKTTDNLSKVSANSGFLNFLQSAGRKREQLAAKMVAAETNLMKILDKAEQTAEYTATASPAANRI